MFLDSETTYELIFLDKTLKYRNPAYIFQKGTSTFDQYNIMQAVQFRQLLSQLDSGSKQGLKTGRLRFLVTASA